MSVRRDFKYLAENYIKAYDLLKGTAQEDSFRITLDAVPEPIVQTDRAYTLAKKVVISNTYLMKEIRDVDLETDVIEELTERIDELEAYIEKASYSHWEADCEEYQEAFSQLEDTGLTVEQCGIIDLEFYDLKHPDGLPERKTEQEKSLLRITELETEVKTLQEKIHPNAHKLFMEIAELKIDLKEARKQLEEATAGESSQTPREKTIAMGNKRKEQLAAEAEEKKQQ
ncbi:hypothetical protein CYMTET_13057 [Cymbomonas tetramitiformis]|uniref:Uncharacterized protein n=1 Tax=Cymbomonas tetramitiformis TaxID=36881 RepID=A0AAE0GIV9_9CHLO|nr:hypothetical protein CYMTET_13057 [Cymbomonas tetramitiformis]